MRKLSLLIILLLLPTFWFLEGEFIISSWRLPSKDLNSQEITLAFSSNISKLDNQEKNILSKYLKILKNRFNDSLYLFNIGSALNLNYRPDEIQFINNSQYDYLAFDINEYINFNTAKLKTAKFINNNVVDLKENKNLETENIISNLIITNEKLKLGVINILSLDKLKDKKYTQIKGTYLKDDVLAVLEALSFYQKNQVNNVILISNISTSCLPGENLSCPKGDLFFKFLKRLPPNKIKLIITPSKQTFLTTFRDNQILFLDKSKFVYGKLNCQKIPCEFLLKKPIKFCQYIDIETRECIKNNKTIDKVPVMFLGHEVKDK